MSLVPLLLKAGNAERLSLVAANILIHLLYIQFTQFVTPTSGSVMPTTGKYNSIIHYIGKVRLLFLLFYLTKSKFRRIKLILIYTGKIQNVSDINIDSNY